MRVPPKLEGGLDPAGRHAVTGVRLPTEVLRALPGDHGQSNLTATQTAPVSVWQHFLPEWRTMG